MTAFIPIKHRSPIVEPEMMTACPIVTSSPMVEWWSTDWSWTLDREPIDASESSPRTTVPNQTEEPFFISTFPMTVAVGATHAVSASLGTLFFSGITFL
eukprot:CAMPEP_0171463098 /NCGR_PEP_ID=MMETSP0945-20130129/6880_1 /TAXON_ID=109269 /ORGANISM="Vaucheria litorea, Strain CCMP2940" /LENGTH=98 /DNA_ID=CAMNT_0011989773 /DNA_START=265 /DNA_END=561 /DNA_ORIENTATION=-